MSTPRPIEKQIQQTPFQPFGVRVGNGEVCSVRTPGILIADSRVALLDEEGIRVVDPDAIKNLKSPPERNRQR